MPVSMTIDGLSGTVQALHDLGRRDAKRIVRKALRAGGRIIRTAERAEAPRLTGKLRRSIGVVGKKPKGGVLAVGVGPRSAPFKAGPFYPAFVIFGHRAGKSGRVAANDFPSRAFAAAADRAADAAAKMILDELKL